jgi:hypothetical protein
VVWGYKTSLLLHFHLRGVVWAYKTSLLLHFHLREVVWAYKTSLLFHFHLRDMVWAYKTSLLLHFHLSAYTKPGDFASISTIFRLEVRTVLTVLYIFFFIL